MMANEQVACHEWDDDAGLWFVRDEDGVMCAGMVEGTQFCQSYGEPVGFTLDVWQAVAHVLANRGVGCCNGCVAEKFRDDCVRRQLEVDTTMGNPQATFAMLSEGAKICVSKQLSAAYDIAKSQLAHAQAADAGAGLPVDLCASHDCDKCANNDAPSEDACFQCRHMPRECYWLTTGERAGDE